MGRKKAAQQEEILTHPVIFRVTEDAWKKLDKIRANSDCRTVGEVVRRILSRQEVIYFHKDASMDAPMENLVTIKEEIRRIGININQVTRYLNATKTDDEKNTHAGKVAELFNQIEPKIGVLLSLISQLAKKWLQR
ncbi:mobilisation protein (MobC) [Mucilaginibacter pineti]|uniref:Mobilisation protein (MobC) n=1 Tax=Mucilaginibacter pineti TaxID=1391627 RepID=A0A1G7ET19_9SPHI|nr:plasmid mobilization relaxosome protein MobC [Mucilaginibacter pineti]SDE66616.1 mobilisation protein (MobC) [Mucilaginibacter pineti]